MNKIPLSKIQEQFWILNKLYKLNPAYNLPSVFRIKGFLNIEALRLSVTNIISQHDILRTKFIEENGLPWQIVSAAKDELFEIPVTAMNEKYNSNNISDVILQEIHCPFDLNSGSLLRVKLFKYDEKDFLLTIVFHHIIVDFHSKEIFSKELSVLYNSYVNNTLPLIEKPSGQYSDFCHWQQKWLLTDEAKKMLAGWKSVFINAEESLNLPTDFLQAGKFKSDGRKKLFLLDRVYSKKIRNFSKKRSVNSFTLLLALYSIFLSRLSGQSRITIGVPFTNRRKEEFKSTFGCFMNILPIQINFNENTTLINLIEQVRKELLMVHRRQEIPFLLLNSSFGENTGNAIFQSGFTFEPPMRLNLKGVEVSPVIFEREGLQLEFFLTLWEERDCFQAFFEYPDQLYKEDTIKRYWNIFCTIIQSALSNPDNLIGELNITSLEDSQFIKNWNKTDVPYEKNLCIHHKFEQQVKLNPDLTAILDDTHSLTYKELNNHVNRMANYLINTGIKVGDKVAVCSDRSFEMMISILGILKSGAAYLPLSPENPAERLKSIINDANPKLILATENSSLNLPEDSPVVFIDKIVQNPLSENSANPGIKMTSKNLAYILYTSGSTGTPKGVMIEHHSVLNRLGWMQKAYPIDQKDTLLQKTPITFDVSVWELFWWFFNGARLVLLPKGGEKNPVTILRYINDFKVTTIHFVPSMFSSFVETVKTKKQYKKIENLTRIFLSGEVLPLKQVKEFNEIRELYSMPDLINLYGPTEATVDVSYYNCPIKDIRNVYIGRPIDNTKLFVVDKKNNILPVGLPGELIITGVNLARGYLNRPDLTSEKFFDFRISKDHYIRAYRSGDLAKFTSDGEIDYLGRLDNQVKIRGFRIELGEIESKLLEHPMISNCAVFAAEKGGQKYLFAYVCLRKGTTIEVDKLRIWLSSKLPDYMVPSYISFLESLPLTGSGKLDYKSLPVVAWGSDKNKLLVPSNKFEKRLLNIWVSLLNIEDISVNDNFFDLGGNSLLAINLANLISKEFNVNLDTLTIFEFPSIKDQSEFLAGGERNKLFSGKMEIDEKIRRKKNVNFKMHRH